MLCCPCPGLKTCTFLWNILYNCVILLTREPCSVVPVRGSKHWCFLIPIYNFHICLICHLICSVGWYQLMRLGIMRMICSCKLKITSVSIRNVTVPWNVFDPYCPLRIGSMLISWRSASCASTKPSRPRSHTSANHQTPTHLSAIAGMFTNGTCRVQLMLRHFWSALSSKT